MSFWEECFEYCVICTVGLLMLSALLYGPVLLLFGIVELWQWLFA